METKISVLVAEPGEEYRAAYAKAIAREADMELVAQTDNGLRRISARRGGARPRAGKRRRYVAAGAAAGQGEAAARDRYIRDLQ